MKNNLAISAFLLLTTMAFAAANPVLNAAPAAGGNAQTTSGTQAKPAAGKHAIQAKSQEELKAWQEAYAKIDAAQLEAAADAFAAKYPNSELKAALYVKAMNMYGQANNIEKLVDSGRKAIAADPTNPVPLVQVASALAEGTRDTDLDRDQRLNEAAKDAHAAIANIDDLMSPPDAPPDKVAAVKASILTMSYDSLGMVDLNKKDYAAAEQDLMKAADESKAHPEAVVYLRLSVAQDQLKKYPQALESANKAVELAPPGSAAQNLAKQQQSRLQKLSAAGTGTPSSTTPPSTPAPTAPPAPTTTSPTTPH